MNKNNIKYSIKYKLVSCNNPLSEGYQKRGKTDYLQLLEFKYANKVDRIDKVNKVFWFGSLSSGGLRSSLIKDIKKEDNKVIIQTLNTEYIFEEVSTDTNYERGTMKDFGGI